MAPAVTKESSQPGWYEEQPEDAREDEILQTIVTGVLGGGEVGGVHTA